MQHQLVSCSQILYLLMGIFQRFHDAAYSAMDRSAILAAMNEFLDESLVLPPGDFDSTTLLPIMYMAQQKLKEKKAKEAKAKAELEQQKEGNLELKLYIYF